MSASHSAIIIGGGIGGLAAGIALRHAGCRVQVFERAPALREVGAGISLWPNEESASVTARFIDGRSISGDFLIGADGLHSVVRARLFGEALVRFGGSRLQARQLAPIVGYQI